MHCINFSLCTNFNHWGESQTFLLCMGVEGPGLPEWFWMSKASPMSPFHYSRAERRRPPDTPTWEHLGLRNAHNSIPERSCLTRVARLVGIQGTTQEKVTAPRPSYFIYLSGATFKVLYRNSWKCLKFLKYFFCEKKKLCKIFFKVHIRL